MGDDDERRPDEVKTEFDRLPVTEHSGGVRFTVQVRPKSSRSAVLGVREESLEVALRSPPADNEANAELVLVLSKALGVRRAEVTIISGHSSRKKLLAVHGVQPDELRARLGRARR